MKLDYIFLGSTNPSKKRSVKMALLKLKSPSEIKIKTYSVNSKVSNQPMSNFETKKGSINRALQALRLGRQSLGSNQKALMCGMGIESGVYEINNQMWTTGWVTLATVDKKFFSAQGGGFLLPSMIAGKIRQGQTLAEAMDDVCEEDDIRSKQGAIGVFTDNFETRSSIYAPMVSITLSLWAGFRNKRKQGKDTFYKTGNIKKII